MGDDGGGEKGAVGTKAHDDIILSNNTEVSTVCNLYYYRRQRPCACSLVLSGARYMASLPDGSWMLRH